MTKLKSTARVGAVTIYDKHGKVASGAPLSPSVPLQKIAWMVRLNRLHNHHEHDFSPLFDGAHILVCSCGAVQEPDGEVY